jgi:phage/plasmid-associated DNA primase
VRHHTVDPVARIITRKKYEGLSGDTVTPHIKEALAAQAIVDEYNKTTPAPQIIEVQKYTDLGNAKRFVALHWGNIRYVPAWKCWMVWDGKRWVGKDDRIFVPLVDEMICSMFADATGLISSEDSERLKKHAKATEAENRIMATIRLAASQPGVQADPDDFDTNKYLLNFINGTVDLHTKRIKPFDREDMITRMCAIPYIPGQERETRYSIMMRMLSIICKNS